MTDDRDRDLDRRDGPSAPSAESAQGRSVSRSAFLKGAGAVFGGGALLGTGLGGAASASTGGTPQAGATGSTAARTRTPRAVTTTKIADLTGPGLTDTYRMPLTDLGIPIVTPDGRTLYVFGDTFEGESMHETTNWRAPVGLYSTTTDLPGGVQWSGAVGGDIARQLWPYDHDNGTYTTILPADVVRIGDTIYLYAMLNDGLHNVVETQIWQSIDSGDTWTYTGASFPGKHADGSVNLFQQPSGAVGDDGYVYLMATAFTRKHPLILKRVRAERITDPAAYEPWGCRDGTWGWGNPETPILEGAEENFGELCFRPLEGKWVLIWFNDPPAYRIEGMLMDAPTDDLDEAYRQTLIHGTEWGDEDDNHVAQLYGGYIIPGSTLDDMHLSVSQWNTEAGWPYRTMQFRVRGFGT